MSRLRGVATQQLNRDVCFANRGRNGDSALGERFGKILRCKVILGVSTLSYDKRRVKGQQLQGVKLSWYRYQGWTLRLTESKCGAEKAAEQYATANAGVNSSAREISSWKCGWQRHLNPNLNVIASASNNHFFFHNRTVGHCILKLIHWL
jgi:hypothetical protein